MEGWTGTIQFPSSPEPRYVPWASETHNHNFCLDFSPPFTLRRKKFIPPTSCQIDCTGERHHHQVSTQKAANKETCETLHVLHSENQTTNIRASITNLGPRFALERCSLSLASLVFASKEFPPIALPLFPPRA